MREIQGFSGEIKLINSSGHWVDIIYAITPLGKMEVGNKIIIQATVLETEGFYGLQIDQKTNDIDIKKNVGPEILSEKEIIAYQKKVTILGVKFPYTKADQNYFVILETQNDGKIRYWELSVINQNENFFFVVQKVYEAQCSKDENGKIVCPYFETEEKNWPQLIEVLQGIYSAKLELLPKLSKRIVSEESAFLNFANNEGVVLWWNFRRNSGVILTKKGPAKVYWEDIESGKSPVYLTANKHVIFENLVTPTHRTELKWKAIGVEELPEIFIKPENANSFGLVNTRFNI